MVSVILDTRPVYKPHTANNKIHVEYFEIINCLQNNSEHCLITVLKIFNPKLMEFHDPKLHNLPTHLDEILNVPKIVVRHLSSI